MIELVVLIAIPIGVIWFAYSCGKADGIAEAKAQAYKEKKSLDISYTEEIVSRDTTIRLHQDRLKELEEYIARLKR